MMLLIESAIVLILWFLGAVACVILPIIAVDRHLRREVRLREGKPPAAPRPRAAAPAPVVDPWPELAQEPKPRPKRKPSAVPAPPPVPPVYWTKWTPDEKSAATQDGDAWDRAFEETLKASPRLSFMVSPDGQVTPPGRGSTR